MGPKATLIIVEELKLVKYMLNMHNVAHPLNVTNLKSKVGGICQEKFTSFQNGIPDKSWLKQFKRRHLQLVLRIFQGFDLNKAKGLWNGIGKVLASRGFRNVHSIIPNEREWIFVLTCINAKRDSISKYYIFRARRDYLALCETRSTFELQKKDG